MEKSLINVKYDERLSNFIIGYFFVQALNLLIKLIIGEVPYWGFISKAFLACLLLLAIKPIIKRRMMAFFIVESVAVLMFSYSLIYNNAVINSDIINVFTVFIPMAIAISSIENRAILLKKMYIFSWPIQVILIIVLFNMSDMSYSMIGGYTLIFQTLIVFDHFCIYRKWYDLLLCIFDILIIFIFGSRGPVICFGMMVLLTIFFSNHFSRLKKASIIIGVTVIIIIIYVYYDYIITQLLNIVDMLGYESRNLQLLLSGAITSDSGRNYIIDYYLDKIKYGPVLGFGIGGGWEEIGTYPHNIFVELLVSFGVLFGTIAILLMIVIIFFGIITKNGYDRRLMQILTSYCASLMLSNSFIMCPMFFMLIGLGCCSLKIKIKLKS